MIIFILIGTETSFNRGIYIGERKTTFQTTLDICILTVSLSGYAPLIRSASQRFVYSLSLLLKDQAHFFLTHFISFVRQVHLILEGGGGADQPHQHPNHSLSILSKQPSKEATINARLTLNFNNAHLHRLFEFFAIAKSQFMH